ncbi:hypothetical protein [Halomonas halocynthiae]|uniref:DUF7940 domain-containing protein n=1 Tax=Halomonas halocynthiae TaxID=176290 RepID=UPI000489170B|nr:hypothetical protein [Halomonas halocynthiae]
MTDDSKHWSKFWSVRLSMLAAVLAALEASLPLWQDVVPAGAFAAASTSVAMLAAGARVVKQSIKGRD